MFELLTQNAILLTQNAILPTLRNSRIKRNVARNYNLKH